jgi:hypothetical protein
MLTEIHRKANLGLPHKDESDVMNHLGGFLTQMAYSGEFMSDWSEDIEELKESIEKIAEQENRQ